MLVKRKHGMMLIALVVMMLLVAGCGSSTGSKADSAEGHQSTNTESNPSDDAPVKRVDLTISAAASMTDALKEIEKNYEAAHPNVELNFNFGGSGALQQQIEQGAPADLFLSAADKNMKALVDKQLIMPDKEMPLLKNELVAVVPADAKASLATIEDLTDAKVKTVAIGIPESVPAGSYAKEALTNSKLWEPLQSKIVQAKDVRQVLQYVETGNADAGFVYKTDAMTSSKVEIAFTVDSSSYTPVEYPIGIVKATKHAAEAEDFYNYLQSKAALDVFTKYGFSVPK